MGLRGRAGVWKVQRLDPAHYLPHLPSSPPARPYASVSPTSKAGEAEGAHQQEAQRQHQAFKCKFAKMHPGSVQVSGDW